MRVIALTLALLPLSGWSACTIDGTTNGAITVFSNLVLLSGAGTYTVTHDGATAEIPGIQSLVSPVQGVDLAGFMTLSPQVISGPNAGAAFGGADSSARVASLPNAGTDVIQIGVSGTLDAEAKPGTYTVSAILNCN